MKKNYLKLAAVSMLFASTAMAQAPSGLIAITPEGVTVTASVTSFDNLSTTSKRVVPIGNKIFFSASTAASGDELWVSDGTPAGTKMVKDINPGTESSAPQWLTAVGDKCYFAANTPDAGVELWVSDGTEGGTKLVKDIYPGTASSSPIGLTELNGKVVFFAMDDISTLAPVIDSTKPEKWLWISDGTENGTELIGETPTKEVGYDGAFGRIVVLNNKGYFVGYSPEFNETLWYTDGTFDGTKPMLDINPTRDIDGSWATTKSASIDWITKVGNKLLFRAETTLAITKDPSLGTGGNIGSEIWVSDGTPEGTKWIGVDFGYSGPSATTPAPTQFAFALPLNENIVLFRANDGVHNVEPCIMDLSKPFVKGVNPRNIKKYNSWNFPTSNISSWPQYWTGVFDGHVYFEANGWAYDPNTKGRYGTGQSLCRLDVSSMDIAKIDSISSVYCWTYPNSMTIGNKGGNDNSRHFTQVGERLYFVAEDAKNNAELWYMDKIDARPNKYCDFLNNGNPHNLRVFNENLYFVSDATKTLYKVDPESASNPEVALSNVTLYPNPVSDNLNIKSEEEIAEIHIYDLQGRIMANYKGNTTTINVSNLNKGIYQIDITLVGGKRIVEKLSVN